jgi:hypothetical protein
MAGDIVFFPNARLIQSQSNYCSTKGVGGTAPNLSDAKTLDDGAVVPLGKPEEQQGSKVGQTKYDSVHSKNSLTLHMSTHMTANNLYDIVSPCAIFIIYC